ncbi:MAG: TerC family protein [Cytophagales bacterium]|nr:TerC family protein [Bernardetiaceae bacterium]MDW8210367.1 TerC family protein [Cytophagales bacterium]
MFDVLFTSEGLISLATLTALEIVLGIDNIIFISIIVSRLPKAQQSLGRQIGLLSALLVRLLLLLIIKWIIGLEKELFAIAGIHLSGKDLILIIGGLFLIAKSTSEIHAKIEHAGKSEEEIKVTSKAATGLAWVLIQAIFINIVFSFDSVLTAIGLVKEIIIMAIAIIASIAVMVFFVNQISSYIERHPTVKMLALSFLIMIGILLVSEGLDVHFPKGYVYFAMAYSFVVEQLNIRLRKKIGSSF